MATTFQRVKGTRDLLPPETALWAAVEDVARRVFSRYGYQEIRTPILEPTELFVRSIGETSDVVGKEMYTFDDRKGRSVTMRPENTAAVVRAVIEAGLTHQPGPHRLFYIGPQFRYERPQKGRYRQFHQIGAEMLGDPGPWSDVELLAMLVAFLRELGFARPRVLLNTLGDEESRGAWSAALREFLRPQAARLGEDSRRRLDANPLRILDTKDPAERELLEGAPGLDQFLSASSRQHFAALCDGLARLGIDFAIEERLVRGLDYYTHTVFEIVAEGLGAQNALCGGGRYDRLVEDLGGPAMPSLGFAIGQDRLLEVLPPAFRAAVAPAPPVLVAGAQGASELDLLALGEELREAGVVVELDLASRSIKAAFKRAERVGARWMVLIGADELANGEVTVRDLERRDQRCVPRGEVLGALAG